jgi:hypothetical protein
MTVAAASIPPRGPIMTLDFLKRPKSVAYFKIMEQNAKNLTKAVAELKEKRRRAHNVTSFRDGFTVFDINSKTHFFNLGLSHVDNKLQQELLYQHQQQQPKVRPYSTTSSCTTTTTAAATAQTTYDKEDEEEYDEEEEIKLRNNKNTFMAASSSITTMSTKTPTKSKSSKSATLMRRMPLATQNKDLKIELNVNVKTREEQQRRKVIIGIDDGKSCDNLEKKIQRWTWEIEFKQSIESRFRRTIGSTDVRIKIN